jgi:capsular polysaccharide biosynthesis protein
VDLRTLLRILVRRWIVVVPTIVVAVLVGQQMLSSVEPEYQAKGSLLLLAPVTPPPPNEPRGLQTPNPIGDSPATLDQTTLAMVEIMNDEPNKDAVADQGLSRDFEVTTTEDAPILTVTATSERRRVAIETASAVLDLMKLRLQEREARLQIANEDRISTEVLSTPTTATTVNAARTRALVAMIALGIGAVLSVALLVESWAQSPARRQRRRATDVEPTAPPTRVAPAPVVPQPAVEPRVQARPERRGEPRRESAERAERAEREERDDDVLPASEGASRSQPRRRQGAPVDPVPAKARNGAKSDGAGNAAASAGKPGGRARAKPPRGRSGAAQ